jgi:ABC-type multidrug transport system ATPase subunit
MAAVRNLANQNRTVICTIHQPSQQTFDLFDTLLLLAKGRVIYFGLVREAVEYFAGSPYQFQYRANSNTAEYVVAVAGGFLCAVDGHHISGDELADYYRSTQTTRFVVDNQAIIGITVATRTESSTATNVAQKDAEEEAALEFSRYNTSTYHQIKTLIHRALLKTAKDRRVTIAATFRCR